MTEAPKRRSDRNGGQTTITVSPRDRTLHFRVQARVADALEAVAVEEHRSVSAWVALCVEDRLRKDGRLG